jgi:Zn-dependent protease with chaperone function
VGYSSAGWWLVAGITRDLRGVFAGMIAAWFYLPLAITLAVSLAIGGGLLGAFGGTAAASDALHKVPVFGDVLAHFALQAGGGLGALVGIFAGALGGGLGGLALPWVQGYLDDPITTILVLVLNVVFALVVGVLYTIYAVIFEPFRLNVAGARRLSRREADFLVPLLHECAARLDLPNVPKLLMDDAQGANALAYTRHIVLQQGFLTAFDHDREAVSAVLSHELTHWRNADGVARLMVQGAALPVYLAYSAVSWVLRTFDNLIIRFFTLLVSWPVIVAVRYFIVPLQSSSARAAEYRADRGAVRAGHLRGIRLVLEEFKGTFDGSRRGWDQTICASHPPVEHRLERLEERGVDYSLAPVEPSAIGEAS